MEDFWKCVCLGSNVLLFVSFYSFINIYNSFNCVFIFSDGVLVVGGFFDLLVKVWDMVKFGE